MPFLANELFETPNPLASHYSRFRVTGVFRFHHLEGLAPTLWRQVSQHQIDPLARRFDDLDVDAELIGRDRSVTIEENGGFLALRSRQAGETCRLMKLRGVATDSRGETLRLGSTPYMSDTQPEMATDYLGEVAGSLGGRR